MSGYRYVTPNWEDYQNNFIDEETNKKNETYVITHLYILNSHTEDAIINVHFYDNFGAEFTEMAVSNLTLPAKACWNTRIHDIIVKSDPNYATLHHSRKGWLSISSNKQLAVSGKILSARKPFNDVLSEDTYVIPFFETPLEDHTIVYDPNKKFDEPIDPKGWKIPKPFPR